MAKDHVGTVSQRAEQIDKVRDLTVLGVNGQISSRVELSELAIKEKILVRKDGRAHDYTSVYRYLDALHFLGLDVSTEYDYKQGEIKWSNSALELAQLGSGYYRSQFLSIPEKKILRKLIFLSKAKEQFLSSFYPDNTLIHNEKDFLNLASPLYITDLSAQYSKKTTEQEEWPAETCVRVTRNVAVKGVLKPKKEFLYTYRYWCLDTGIIDELNIREAKRYGIPKSESYVLFPIEHNVKNPDQFIELLQSAVGYVLTRPQAFSIPWLMYNICPKAKVSVEDFKAALVNACTVYRNYLHLERGPGGLIKDLEIDNYNKFDKRYGNHRYYPLINGTVRTNLIVFPLPTKGEEHE